MVSTISRTEYMEMYNVIGACMEVYNTAGRGMEEPVYQEMLALELNDRNIPFEKEKKLTIQYKSYILEKYYVADFYVNGIVVELKAVEKVCSDHRAQLFNYMRISKQKRGLLINFGEKHLHTERYLYQEEDDDFILLNEDNLHQFVK